MATTGNEHQDFAQLLLDHGAKLENTQGHF